MVTSMTDAANTNDPRPYHHGDLSRALVDAARRLLEQDGPSALSLRAVAREAGVSPAAPYHHFKDKSELLDAVAHQGWDMLNERMTEARAKETTLGDKLTALGVSYVQFAREHPALYRVMYDCSREKATLPEHLHEADDSAYCQVRDVIAEVGGEPVSELDIELATTAAWCAAHGLAEMVAFKQFDPMKEALGGDEAFLRGVFTHLGIFGSAYPKP